MEKEDAFGLFRRRVYDERDTLHSPVLEFIQGGINQFKSWSIN